MQIVGDLLQLAMYLVAGDLRGLRAHSRGMGIIYNALSLITLLWVAKYKSGDDRSLK